jgi:hypothetical protein
MTGSTIYTTNDVTSLEVTVLDADTTDNYQYQGLTVTSQSTSIGNTADDNGVYWVSGTLKNTGSETAGNLRVFGTFYNSAGQVVAVGGYDGTEVLVASLAPGASKDFKFGAYDINQTSVPTEYKIATYTLLVQADSPTPTGTPPTVTPYPSNTFPKDGAATPNGNNPTDAPTDNNDPSGTQTPNTGGTSNDALSGIPTWVYAVVGVVALVVVVGAVLALRARKQKAEPPTPEVAPKKTKRRHKR